MDATIAKAQMPEQQISFSNFFYSYNDAYLNPSIDCQLETLFPLDLRPTSLVPGLSDLGHLENLPTEILLTILENLPLISLIRFRNVSRRTHYIVDTMHKFRIIVEQVPNAIRGILAVQTKVRITLNELLEKLCQRHCDRCRRELAQHLWLPTTSRLCYYCSYGGQDPCDIYEMVHWCGFTDEEVKLLPSFRLLPARFIRTESKGRQRIFEALKGGIFYDTTHLGRLLSTAGKRWPPPLDLYLSQYRFLLDFVPPFIQNGATVLTSTMLPLDVRRNTATILAPWITSNGPEMGFFCKMCLYTKGEDKIHTSSGFRKHLQSCRVQPFNENALWMRFRITGTWYFEGDFIFYPGQTLKLKAE